MIYAAGDAAKLFAVDRGRYPGVTLEYPAKRGGIFIADCITDFFDSGSFRFEQLFRGLDTKALNILDRLVAGSSTKTAGKGSRTQSRALSHLCHRVDAIVIIGNPALAILDQRIAMLGALGHYGER